MIICRLLKIDRAVNSPFNLVSLCPPCHRLAHPDMGNIDQIAGLVDMANTGMLDQVLLSEDEREKLVLRVVGSEVKISYFSLLVSLCEVVLRQ